MFGERLSPTSAECANMWDVKLLCEDLPQHGLVLVPPSSAEYEGLLADIERRANAPVEGSPPFPAQFRPRIVAGERETSAILLNRNAKAIAGLQVVWRFETEGGRKFRHSKGMLSPRGVLLPYEPRTDAATKLYAYWNTVFAGSKRYLGESGMVGDNTDVRPPADEEKWRGGMVVGGGGGGVSEPEAIRQVTLVLDGVFFVDGEFVGPDGEKMFEQTVAEAEAHRMLASIAKSGHEKGIRPGQILAEMEKATGAAPEGPPIRAVRRGDAPEEEFLREALQTIAYQIAMRRRSRQPREEERIVYMVMSWGDAAVVRLRRG